MIVFLIVHEGADGSEMLLIILRCIVDGAVNQLGTQIDFYPSLCHRLKNPEGQESGRASSARFNLSGQTHKLAGDSDSPVPRWCAFGS